MRYFIKVLGSGRSPCPEPYTFPYVDFGDARNPGGRIRPGDQIVLYAAGGRKNVFGVAAIDSEVYPSGDLDFPHRLDIRYTINLSPEMGIPIEKLNVHRDLGVSIRRNSYIELTEEEFKKGLQLLTLASAKVSPGLSVGTKRSFTTYWKNDTWASVREVVKAGTLLDHTASDKFVERGVSVGDAVYVVTVEHGRLLVAAKLDVGRICDIAEASKILGIDNLWKAKDHLIASGSSVVDWDREIPTDIVRRLEFLGSGGKKTRLVVDRNNNLDQQTLRGVRRLASESANLLDRFLGPVLPIPTLWNDGLNLSFDGNNELESYADGKKKMRYVTYYERDPNNRAAAIRIHGYRCKACDLQMDEVYGPHGRHFIHVHHIKPVSEYEKPTEIDPATDLTVLCPNCHAMVHKNKSETLSVEQLRKLVQDQRARGTRGK